MFVHNRAHAAYLIVNSNDYDKVIDIVKTEYLGNLGWMMEEEEFDELLETGEIYISNNPW